MRKRYGISIGNVLHPTDFSHGSEVAFAHALRIAVDAKGELEVLHVDRDDSTPNWDDYPSVRETLSRWALIPANAPKSAVPKLGVRISKSACKSDQTSFGVLRHIETRGADLVVMATHQREGLARWMHKSLAEEVSNTTDAATLFVPYGMDGFVNLESGKVELTRILIPVDRSPDPQPVVDAVGEMVETLASDNVEIRLLHVGDPSEMPSPTLPDTQHCQWVWESLLGNVVDQICAYAEQHSVDLVAMTTSGHHGFLDALRGSTTERVLNRVKCPVLSVHDTKNQ